MASVAAGTRGGVTNSKGSGGSSGLGDGGRVGGTGKDKMDKKTKAALEAAFGPAAQATRQLDTPDKAKASSAFSGAGSDPTPNDLPPGLSPSQYEEAPTQSFEATPSNLIDVGLSIAGMVAPGVSAATTIGKALLDGPESLLDPFDSPTGPTTTGVRKDHAPAQDQQTAEDEFGQPTLAVTPSAPPAEVPVPDLWEYPNEETDVKAGVPQDGLSDEERRRRGNTSIVVLGQGGLAI